MINYLNETRAHIQTCHRKIQAGFEVELFMSLLKQYVRQLEWLEKTNK